MDIILTEDDLVQEDLDNRDDQYRDIYSQLLKYTDNFTKESGSYPLQTKSEYENAVKILKDHYNVAEKDGLDYKRAEDDGTDYKVVFSKPKETDESYNESKVLDMFVDDINESLIFEDAPTYDMLSDNQKQHIYDIDTKAENKFRKAGGNITYADDLEDDPLDDYYAKKYAKSIMKRRLERYGFTWKC